MRDPKRIDEVLKELGKFCGCQTNYEHPMQKAIDVWNRRAEK